MAKIPICFYYDDQVFVGSFLPVAGAASSSRFDLNISGYYKGQLWLAEDCKPGLPRDPNNITYKWKFSSQTGEFEGLSRFFGEVIARVNG